MRPAFLLAMATALTAAGLQARAEPAASPPRVSLPCGPRAISDDLSASRDASVFEYAYGPRAQLSLGHELGLLAPRCDDVSLHLALSALGAFENARSHSPLPDELARLLTRLTFTVSLDRWSRARLGNAGAVELGLGLGFERARELRSAESDRVVPDAQPGDIPFGGGGGWLGFDAAMRFSPAPEWILSIRILERVFWNAWPLMVGARAESDAVAAFIGDGLSHAPSIDATVRWLATPGVRPLASVFAEGLFPHDRSADASYFARALVGVGLPGELGEAIPFLSVELGSGKGLLINRHELRLSLGARHVF
jgi:hypothetical protein